MLESTTAVDADTNIDIDNLTWDDWDTAQICSIENGPDCAACEG